MNKFKFHGVGQGLFYAGTLINGMYNFVFDCGTSNRKFYIDRHISGYIHEISHNEKKPHIHLAVISHLHKDHFSGLPELANRAIIDKIYLPYLGNNTNFIKFALAYAIFYNAYDNYMAEDEYRSDLLLYAYMLKLYNIEDDLHNEVVVDIAIPQQIKYCNTYNEKGKIDTFCLDKLWQFEIYYRNFNEEVIVELTAEIGKHVRDFDSFNLIDLIRSSKKTIAEIARGYESIFGKANRYRLDGGINMSSAVMIHYPLYYGAYTIIHNGNEDKSDIVVTSAVTVLSGDARDFDKYPMLLESIEQKQILFFQVPHHGSIDNWNSMQRIDIHTWSIDYFVISFGFGNMYGHPHANTLENLIEMNKKFYFVTQLNSLEYAILG